MDQNSHSAVVLVVKRQTPLWIRIHTWLWCWWLRDRRLVDQNSHLAMVLVVKRQTPCGPEFTLGYGVGG